MIMNMSRAVFSDVWEDKHDKNNRSGQFKIPDGDSSLQVGILKDRIDESLSIEEMIVSFVQLPGYTAGDMERCFRINAAPLSGAARMFSFVKCRRIPAKVPLPYPPAQNFQKTLVLVRFCQ